MLNAIKIKDFKCHNSLETHFAGGLTTICGKNYAGKTSLLQAVLVAFFGVSALPGGAKVATRRGAKGFEVVVDFEADGTEYRVRRTKSQAELSKDGEIIANSVSQVTTEIESLLGMSRKRFTQIKVAQQKQTAALLTLGAGELHSVIEEITGADLISKVIDELKTDTDRSKAQLAAIDAPDEPVADLQTRAGLLESDYAALQKDLEAAGTEVEAAEQAVEDARQALDDAKASNHQLELKQTRLEHLQDEAKRVQGWLDEARERQGDAPSDQAIYESETRVSEVKSWLSEKDKVSSNYQAACDLIKRAQKQASDAQREAKGVTVTPVDDAEVDQVQADYDAALRRFETARQKVDTLQQSLESAICPTCQRPFEDHDPDKLRAELNEASKEESIAEAERDDAKKRSKQKEAQYRDAVKAQERIDGFKKVYEDNVEIYKDAKARADELAQDMADSEALEEAREELQDVETTLSHQRAAKSVAEQAARDAEKYSTQYAAVAEEMESLKGLPAPTEIEPLEGRLSAAKATSTNAQEKQARLEQRTREKEADLAETRRLLESAQKAEAQRKSLESRVSLARQLSQYLRDNRNRFLADVWASVMAQASHFASVCTGGTIEQVIRTEAGSFAYVEAGEEMPIEAASGAQSSIMGLGVQLALSRLLPSGFRATLLDEPTADMTDGHALTLTSALAALNQQVVIVSHREFDASAAENVIQLDEE